MDEVGRLIAAEEGADVVLDPTSIPEDDQVTALEEILDIEVGNIKRITEESSPLNPRDGARFGMNHQIGIMMDPSIGQLQLKINTMGYDLQSCAKRGFLDRKELQQRLEFVDQAVLQRLMELHRPLGRHSRTESCTRTQHSQTRSQHFQISVKPKMISQYSQTHLSWDKRMMQEVVLFQQPKLWARFATFHISAKLQTIVKQAISGASQAST